MTCSDCRFYKVGSPAGMCRKAPPQLFVMEAPKAKIVGGQNQNIGFTSQFPPTFPDSWCGAYEEAH